MLVWLCLSLLIWYPTDPPPRNGNDVSVLTRLLCSSKRSCEILGKVWMPYKLKIFIVHKLSYSPKRVIIAFYGFPDSQYMKTISLGPQTDFHLQYH